MNDDDNPATSSPPPPPADMTLHIEAVRNAIAPELPLTLILDRITADGVVVIAGAFYPIVRRAIAEPIQLDEGTFLAINTIYQRETHRTLSVPESVQTIRALAMLRDEALKLVHEELAKRGL